ncbi:hypothetical protein [Streptomyces mexicanus]|uniref:hypothetical protein n=1 Tax=Streptomyces mexicanus TaxID=178566 RepID=UPI0036BE23FD
MADGLEPESLQIGDLVKISLAMTPTRVTRVDPYYAYVEWPWHEIDPESRCQWDGSRAFARNPDSQDWVDSPYRTDPEPWHLTENSTCRVGIPETIAQVVDIHRCEQAQDVGWLPRPRLMLGIIPADRSEYIDDEDAGDTLYFPSGEPIVIKRAAE